MIQPPLWNVREDALSRWHLPHPGFASGRDPRSSDNALLALLYGNLQKASHYGWLNAGRTLIDKTYLRILWSVAGLPARGLSFDEMASRLDGFVRTDLRPLWKDLPGMPDAERMRKAIELVSGARKQIFAASADTGGASVLLFFLCPQLPVIPGSESVNTYGIYLGRHLESLAECEGFRQCPAPDAHFGQAREQAQIRSLLAESDWWPRRLLWEQQRLAAKPLL